MTVTTEVRLPFRKRLHFLLTGRRLVVTTILEASWFVQMRAHHCVAWLEYPTNNDVLRNGECRLLAEAPGVRYPDGSTLTVED